MPAEAAPMRLSRFIRGHMKEILGEWESFARTQEPAADGMSVLALRDHAEPILQAIALDIETRQSAHQQEDKAKGLAPDKPSEKSPASIHGALRQASNFSLLQLSAEFRALRASVLRLWLPNVERMSADTVHEVVRFNEAIDQALTESVITYSSRADHMRELFLAVLGHDLRTPLSTMVVSAGLLSHRNLKVEDASAIGARIRRSATLMSAMVNDLLGYSQTQLGGGMPVTRRDSRMQEVCEAALEEARSANPECSYDLRASGDLRGSFDPVRLHQLFANLLANAAQYGARDRPIVMTARGEAEAITVQVINQGADIPEAALRTMFTPLVQLPRDDQDETRPRTSLGLGLFVAREIAEAHGGTIAAQSGGGQTAFTVRFPR
jgi:signal transduction histidine kinase